MLRWPSSFITAPPRSFRHDNSHSHSLILLLLLPPKFHPLQRLTYSLLLPSLIFCLPLLRCLQRRQRRLPFRMILQAIINIKSPFEGIMLPFPTRKAVHFAFVWKFLLLFVFCLSRSSWLPLVAGNTTWAWRQRLLLFGVGHGHFLGGCLVEVLSRRDGVVRRLTVVRCAFCRVCNLKWWCSKVFLSKFACSLENILKNVLDKEKVSKYELFKGGCSFWKSPVEKQRDCNA
jgi:hypothetical protein